MKYLLAGLLIGTIAGFLLFRGASASEIMPEFYNPLQFDSIVSDSRSNPNTFIVPMVDRLILVDTAGNCVRTVEHGDELIEFSGNGDYYIKYGRIGTKIELFGIKGERYWQKDSREKPFISYNGKIVFLLNGDHSGIRIFDTNGNSVGSEQIIGRLCTSIEFSGKNDFGACGFIDGHYCFTDEQGVIINSGRVPVKNSVKGTKISNNGKYGFIHYGNTTKDWVRIVNINKNRSYDSSLENVHVVRTAMNITDDGDGAFFDNDKILLFDKGCNLKFKLDVPKKKAGFSTLSFENGIYVLGYTKNTGESQLVVFKSNGDIFYAKDFSNESFLSGIIRDDLIFLRGSDNLLAYKIRLSTE
ncbi:MAG: hypothetical protein FWF73_03335 [Spirochaetes bacterium]|nr:hypothetical protein [Spirochaetota bacterium]